MPVIPRRENPAAIEPPAEMITASPPPVAPGKAKERKRGPPRGVELSVGCPWHNKFTALPAIRDETFDARIHPARHCFMESVRVVEAPNRDDFMPATVRSATTTDLDTIP